MTNKKNEALYKVLAKIIKNTKVSNIDKITILNDLRDDLYQKTFFKTHKSSQDIINYKFNKLI